MLQRKSLFCGAAAVALTLSTATVTIARAADVPPAQPEKINVGAPNGGQSTTYQERFVALGGPVTPSYGDISPLYGPINPFYGSIQPFYGDISPFWGNLTPFWGPINPFYGDISPFWGDLSPLYGSIQPFWGDIQPFWGNIQPLWGNINAFWGNLQPLTDANAAQYSELQGLMQDFYTRSEGTWAPRVLQSTGKDFYNGFAKNVFAKYGINLETPESLSGLTAENRARFFMDWYDGLMEYSGMDHVDHWMATVNWNPALTQDQGKGADAVIGLLDARITGDADLLNNIEYNGGYAASGNDHGAAVASLIFSEHDGRGIMGIAPSAHVMAYNPFDASGTAGWQDVRNGVVALSQRGADVINVSLGVPGWTLHQGMADIISDASLYNQIKNVVFVSAAGNDGKTQTADIVWNSWLPTDNFIVVGSTDINGTISSFSNTPGEACVKVYGFCQDKEDKLKYHFLVAPGELILVSDNHGGVTRMTGTSFAAPLVSGAITLLYDRWPWLQSRPKEAVQMILQSAKDLGAKGVDPVYGWGMLDVEASQSPFNFDNLLIFQGYNQLLPKDLKSSLLSSTKRAAWQASGASLYAFEYFGSTYRDFAIPLSSLLYGSKLNRDGRNERFQRYMYTRMLDWANGKKLTDIDTTFTDAGNLDGWSMGFVTTAANPYSASYNDEMPFQGGYVMHNDETGVGLSFGFGDGATALFARPGFGFYSDYEVETGGVNPILGFASGNAYAAASFDLFDDAKVTLGYTQLSDDHETVDAATGQSEQVMPGTDAYEASALVLDVTYTATSWLTVNASFTHLDEATGLLGVQGAGALGLSGGAQTNAFTVGGEIKFDHGFSFAASATTAKTAATTFSGSSLAIADGGIDSTAFAVALQKAGIFAKDDAMRLSLTQPLHIESGALEFTSMQVIDRDTGELGPVTQKWGMTGEDRQLVAEVLYATPIMDGAAELSFNVKMNLTPGPAEEDEGVTVGSRLAFQF